MSTSTNQYHPMWVYALLLCLLVSACRLVDIEDYVHEPTHGLRQSIVFSGSREVDGINDRIFAVVPNFRFFDSTASRDRAALLVVSKGDSTIRFGDITLTNLDTGATVSIVLPLVYDVSRPVADSEYRLARIPLLDHTLDGLEKIERARQLELNISYRFDGEAEVTETMILKHITRKDVAWVT